MAESQLWNLVALTMVGFLFKKIQSFSLVLRLPWDLDCKGTHSAGNFQKLKASTHSMAPRLPHNQRNPKGALRNLRWWWLGKGESIYFLI